MVADALDHGATVLTGGEVAEGNGYFYPPTVLSGVPRDARMANEEIFSPVTPFDDEDEVVAAANDTEYGLVGIDEFLETKYIGIALT